MVYLSKERRYAISLMNMKNAHIKIRSSGLRIFAVGGILDDRPVVWK
jgi:hypothetical protein